MKKMRKLIPALAMLMVAAVMMSTASFAWFTMSTTATASGMQVRATTSGGLAIAFAKLSGTNATSPASSDYHSTVAFNESTDWTNGGDTLKPTSTNLTGSAWYTASSANTGTHAANAGSYATIASGTDSSYYYKTQLYVKSLSEAADTTGEDLFVDMITVDGTSNGLEKSIRVAINVGTTWFFFAPCYDTLPTGGLKYVSAVTGEGVGTTLANGDIKVGQAELDNVQLLDGALKYTNATVVNVYVYFEGEDENCKTDFAFDLQNISIAITFASVD